MTSEKHDHDKADQKNLDIDEKYRLLAENTVECIWLYDYENRQYRYISPSIYRLRGLTVEEAMTESLEDSLTPESLKKVEKGARTRLRRYLAGDKSDDVLYDISEYRQYRKDGSIVDVEISTCLLCDEQTGHIDVLGVSRDISEKKRLECDLNKEIRNKNKTIRKLEKSENKLVQLANELLEKNKILKSIVIKDELTNLHNRYFLDSRIMEEMQRSDRYGAPLTLIMFDLDNFKNVNDTWGHDAGDKVLMGIADIGAKSIRRCDTLARWGGEEFAILAPDTYAAGGARIAEKLRKAIGNIDFPGVGHVTASFGVGERHKEEPYALWFRRVDQALYRAKQQGRNRVMLCGDADGIPLATVRLNWKPEWACGIRSVDEQHRRLIELANDLMDLSMTDLQSKRTAVSLDALLDHIAAHFCHEEKVLELISYPDAARHASIHKELLAKATELKGKYLESTAKASSFFAFLLDDVVVGHLLVEDVQFFPYTMAYSDQCQSAD